GVVVALIGFLGLPKRVAFEQLLHLGAAGRRDRPALDNFHQHAGGGVGRQLVPILVLFSDEEPFAPIRSFAPRFLVGVDVGMAQRGKVTVDGIGFVGSGVLFFGRVFLPALVARHVRAGVMGGFI